MWPWSEHDDASWAILDRVLSFPCPTEQKEITDIRRDKESGVSVVVSDHDIREMVGCLRGTPVFEWSFLGVLRFC